MRFILFSFSALLALMPVSMSAQDVSGDTIPSSDTYFLPSVIQNNPNLSIYYSALRATGLADTLEQYIDPTYPGVSYDSTLACFMETGRAIFYRTAYEEENGVFPESRYFKYTVFVVPDSILALNYNIRNLEDLRSYAEQQYPSGAGKPDYDRESSLNMFMSYHILPEMLTYEQFNTSQHQIIERHLHLDELDVEDFYETMLPHSIMRISTPYEQGNYGSQIFINRKGTTKYPEKLIPGIQIYKEREIGYQYGSYSLNGIYHYISEPLVYNNATRDALNVRMRIMASTLSPDFINSGARGRLRYTDRDRYVVGFLPGFCKNVQWTEGSELWVRYRDASFGCYNGDEITLRGQFDMTFRLPPVPQNGLYEIRINCYSPMGVDDFRKQHGNLLFYVRQEGSEFIPCGTPKNMFLTAEDLGYVKDDDVDYYDIIQNNPGMTEDEAKELAIIENDKLMRSHGSMKSPDSYTYNGRTSLRDDNNTYRIILCEMYMQPEKDYYLRIRQVNNEYESNIPFNYLEIVPYDVYSGENGPEDRH